jgi:hypothetical protein
MPFGFGFARKAVAGGMEELLPKIGTNSSYGKIVGHKELREHVKNATSDALRDSNHAAAQYVTGNDGMWAAGGERGRTGLRQALGGINHLVGGNAIMKDNYKTAVANGDTKLANEMARGIANPMRYGKAAWDVAAGAGRYMNSGTIAQRAVKMGTATAGVVALGSAGRLVTGGSPFYNSNGQRDIAGIPFI